MSVDTTPGATISGRPANVVAAAVRVPAQQRDDLRMAAGDVGQAALAVLPDPVHVRHVQFQRRVVEAHERRPVRLGQHGVQPGERLSAKYPSDRPGMLESRPFACWMALTS